MTELAPRRHLVLVGLMGAGKTTVGERCAADLGRPFVDTDALVEAAAAQRVHEIFASEGEAGFRARERVALADACASVEPLVIACGGGAVLDAKNRAAMRGTGVVVWLRASPAELAARVGDGAGRPLLAGRSPIDTLRRLAELRAPAYEAAAHVVVDTDGLAVEAVARRVLEEVDRCAV
jgi:shikimate kinase